jgi:hypothetical protein
MRGREMSESEEKKKQQEFSLDIQKMLLDLSDKLKRKAHELELDGNYEKATTCYFLAGYLKGAAELWTKE